MKRGLGFWVAALSLLSAAQAHATGWTLQPSPTALPLYGVSFSSPGTWVAVGDAGTILRSTDGGISWTRVELADPLIFDMAPDPKTPGRIFAITSGGLFVSADDADTWQRIAKHPSPGDDLPYAFIGVDPSRPDVVYAGAPYLGGLFVLQYSPSLYVPRLVVTPGSETTGIALSNRGDRDISLTATAFDHEGRPIEGPGISNPVELRLKPGEQKAILAPDLFGAGLGSLDVKGWVRIDGVSADITGLGTVHS